MYKSIFIALSYSSRLLILCIKSYDFLLLDIYLVKCLIIASSYSAGYIYRRILH